jgi:hypothetical protein
MKVFTQKFIGLVYLLFAISFTVYAQDNDNLYFDTFYSEGFESILGPEWNTSTGELINYNGTSLLGNLAHESISADISNLPPYDSILIEFDLYIFDSWDGQQDQFQVKINNEIVLNTTFLNGLSYDYKWQCFPENCPVDNPPYTGAYSYNLPELYSHGDISSLYKLSFVIDNQVANVVAELTSNSDTDFIDESWGVDNFKLSSYHSDPLGINLTDQEMSYEGFFNNSYYYVSNQETSWYNADSISSSLGGHLVSINSQDENNLVQSFLNSENAWIGLNDTLMEGNWVWSSGEQFDYNNWADGEPNNDDMIEHFVHINYSGNGDWNDDTDETSQFLFVMEVEAIYGCSDPTMYNYDSNVNTDDGSCYPIIEGCMNPIAANYVNPIGDVQIDVNTDDGSCLYSSDVYDNINSTLNNVIDTWQSSVDLTNSTLGEVSLINQTLSSFNTVIYLTEGWNMFGYGCPQSIDVSESLSNYTDLIIITKDNNGNVYMPEFSFNGIGSFSPGYGYQIKISEAIEGFSLCGDFINIDNTQILDIETDNAQMQNDINCLTGNPEIGDYCYGGIVFYVEEGEEGKYGLVAALEDLPGTYEWGCYGDIMLGAVQQGIGFGLKNTNEIIFSCSDRPIAASEVLDYQSNGFGDWYLPSKDELIEMYNSIGNGSTEGNLGSFETDNNIYYWSSLEADDIHAWGVRFSNGYINDEGKASPGRVRAIRDFGNWTKGCMDEVACNYNPEANKSDGSCSYAEEGYDCFGNVIFKSLMFGSNNSDAVIDNFVEVNNVGSQFDLKVGFAISAWVKVLDNHNSLWGCVLGAHNSNGWIFYAGSNSNEGKISFQRSGCPSIDGQTDIRDNEWHHISLVFTEESIIIYLDGEIETIAPNDECYPIITNSDSSISIGESNHNHSSIENFPGLISDIIVWDLNTNNYDINFIMDYQNYNNFNLKISHWNFNQLNNDTILDVSGNEYHGTVNGNVQFSHDSH